MDLFNVLSNKSDEIYDNLKRFDTILKIRYDTIVIK